MSNDKSIEKARVEKICTEVQAEAINWEVIESKDERNMEEIDGVVLPMLKMIFQNTYREIDEIEEKI